MEATSHAQTSTLPLSAIVVGYNPRRYFDKTAHAELVASLKLRGMLQPMLVRPTAEEGRFVIVAGGRRFRAALEAFGPDGEVPVVIRQMSDQEALEAAIDENDIRDNASETEQADAAVRVLAACQNDKSEAAKRLGWSTAKLDRRLALANLSEPVKLALDERQIKIGHAELLAAVPVDKQEAALKTIIGSNLDVATTRGLLMKVTQDLAHAIFDKTECTTCPYNSASQRALFETHVEDGHCTNRSCFELKTEAAEADLKAAEEAEAAAKRPVSAVATGEDEDGELEHAADPVLADSEANNDDDASTDADAAAASVAAGSASASAAPAKTAAPAKPASSINIHKIPVTPATLARRAQQLREETWRSALARALATNPVHASQVVLVAAMSGTISQLKPTTLPRRGNILIGGDFMESKFSRQVEMVRGLDGERFRTAQSAIAAAYAVDVTEFRRVQVLCEAYQVDIRDVWEVNQKFLDLYTKDELKAIAQECGLVDHMGAKAFGKLLTSKKADLIAGMLNATGFSWKGRLPGAMTLDGQYSPPPGSDLAPADAEANASTEAPIADAAALTPANDIEDAAPASTDPVTVANASEIEEQSLPGFAA